MVACLLVFAVGGALALGLALAFLPGQPTGEAERIRNTQPLVLPQMPETPEIAALQPGESVEIAVTPKLREYYFALGRLCSWFYLPEFAEGEQSTYPLDYWYLLLTAGVRGWDENGYWQWTDLWDEVPTGSKYGSGGCAMISQAQFDEWVRAHFGDVELQHQIDTGKYYDFDGKYYYGWAGGSDPVLYYELQSLAAESSGGRIIYTAVLNDYTFNNYSFFFYDPERTLTENQVALEESQRSVEPELLLVYAAYGEQIAGGEVSVDKAIERMIIDGRTDGFPLSSQLQVKYYLNEETGEPFYLTVHWQTADEV